MSDSNQDSKVNENPETVDSDLSEMDQLRAQAEKSKNDFLYLRAEFENYKRNAIKERSDFMKYGAERVFVELLNVVDNFERALAVQVGPENLPTYIKGVEMTAQELKALLQKFGVTEIPSEGMPFNPNFHEALSSEESTTLPEGSISRVFRKPFKLHDRVIRPGQVVVTKKPATN